MLSAPPKAIGDLFTPSMLVYGLLSLAINSALIAGAWFGVGAALSELRRPAVGGGADGRCRGDRLARAR